jgi:hypothetical protein
MNYFKQKHFSQKYFRQYYIYPFIEQSGGGVINKIKKEKEDNRVQRMLRDDDEVLSIIKVFLQCQN